MTRTRWALLVALLTAVCAPASATAAGSYRITAGGDQNWGPQSGSVDQTATGQVEATGTMISTESPSGVNGTADYHVAAGPGIVRAQLAGTLTVPSNLAYPFNPSLQAVATTELTIGAPDDVFVNASVNLHVDGFLDTPVCGSGAPCGNLGVTVMTAPFGRVSELFTDGSSRVNDLGLVFDAVPGGYHVHGDVVGTTFGFRTNTPTPVTIVLNVGGRFGGSSSPSTFGGDFDDPVRQLQVSFATTGPVLGGVPAGYTVSGPGVVDNHWSDPFAPPPGNVVVTTCAQLAQPTVVHGNLVIRNLQGCPSIALPNLTRVDGDLTISGTDAPSIVVGPGTSVGGAIDASGNSGDLTIDAGSVGGAIDASGTGGDLTIDGTSVGGAIDVSSTGGDLTIDGTTGAEAIDANGTGGDLTISGNLDAETIGAGDTGGDLTIVDNGSAVVNAGGGQVGGDMTIETGGDPFSATTAGGATSVTILEAGASMHVVLPAGSFDQPVPFTITRTADTPPEAGTAADGSAAQIDAILGYRFAFAVPTLDATATLTFTVDLSQLDAVQRADLLNAIASGNGTIAVQGDAPDAAFHAFAPCAGSQTPTPDGCVAVTLLDATGGPAAPNGQPAFARFAGAAGHFSTYAVARVLALDTTPPVLTVPAGVAVDATTPKGASVRYTASVRDDRDPSPSLACTPASGSVFAIGDTTASCTATDAARNVGSAHFVVHVRGAGEQLGRLVDKTLAFLDLPALKPGLRAALQLVSGALVAKNARAACTGLGLYVVAVRSAPARALTAAERTELTADATRIQSVLGCGLRETASARHTRRR